MSERLDQVDFPCLQRMAAEHAWIGLSELIGSGWTRFIRCQLYVEAFAAGPGEDEPVRLPGPWRTDVALARGMGCQPLVQIAPCDGRVPVSANISGFPASHDPVGSHPAPAGLVCYVDRWDPTRVTLAWVLYQVARIVGGEVLNLEARPLSKSGRDFQAAALARGELPTHVVSTPRRELLYLKPASTQLASLEIQFLDEPLT